MISKEAGKKDSRLGVFDGVGSSYIAIFWSAYLCALLSKILFTIQSLVKCKFPLILQGTFCTNAGL